MLVNKYEILNVNDIATPALAVYPSIILNNIQKVLEITGSNILRPHIKTCKTPEVIKMMQGEGITRFKCATIAELELLGMLKAKDVLLAYQPVGRNIQRLQDIISAYPDTIFSCLVDNQVSLTAIADNSKEKPTAVFMDLNTGMNRTGIKPEEADHFMDACLHTKRIILKGIHAYDGNINDIELNIRTKNADKAHNLAIAVKEKAEKMSGRKMDLVIGGTPTFAIHAKRMDSQCSPGTFVFWDDGYAAFKELPFTPAAILLTSIISIIDGEHLCLDLGHKAVASENPLNKRLRFLNVDNAELISHSEEHLVVKVMDTSCHHIGDIWYAIPYHICPTMALHQHLMVIENKYFTKEWEVVARKRKINF